MSTTWICHHVNTSKQNKNVRILRCIKRATNKFFSFEYQVESFQIGQWFKWEEVNEEKEGKEGQVEH